MPATPITMWVKGDPETKTLGDCPFCHRALLALELKKLPYEVELVNFNQKPQFVLDQTKNGSVPVMVDGDTIIPDSGDIVTYLDKTYGGTKLTRTEDPELATKLLPSFVNYLKATPEDSGDYDPDLLEQLQEVDTHLSAAGNGPFVGGETMSAADCLLAPRIYHISVALPHFKGQDAFDGRFPEVAKYLEACMATEAFKNTLYTPDAIISGWAAHDGVQPPKA